MFETMIAKSEYEERVRAAERAHRYAHLGRPNRLSMVLKNLVAFVARF